MARYDVNANKKYLSCVKKWRNEPNMLKGRNTFYCHMANKRMCHDLKDYHLDTNINPINSSMSKIMTHLVKLLTTPKFIGRILRKLQQVLIVQNTCVGIRIILFTSRWKLVTQSNGNMFVRKQETRASILVIGKKFSLEI